MCKYSFRKLTHVHHFLSVVKGNVNVVKELVIGIFQILALKYMLPLASCSIYLDMQALIYFSLVTVGCNSDYPLQSWQKWERQGNCTRSISSISTDCSSLIHISEHAYSETSPRNTQYYCY